VTDIAWGSEIPITDGKKPEWLDIDEHIRWYSDCPPDWSHGIPSVTSRLLDGWNKITSIRLRADHPHYTQPADGLRERMEALVRAMCEMTSRAPADYEEARAIVAELDKGKVDPDLLIVREEIAKIYAGTYRPALAEGYAMGKYDDTTMCIAGLAIAKRIRKECGQ
jgi:hypothetical protein